MNVAEHVLNNAIAFRAEYHKAHPFYERDINNLSESLSSDTMRNLLKRLYFSEIPVVTYSDIFNENSAKQFNYIRSYLNAIPQKAAIFLYRQTENYGHWCCIFEHPGSGELYIFDSYGKERPDEYITGTKNKKGPFNSEALGQSAPYLLECINNSDYPYVIWNDYPLQYSSPEVQTCGKWCIIRLINRFATEKEFYKMYTNKSAYTTFPEKYRRDIAVDDNYYIITLPEFTEYNAHSFMRLMKNG
jgi:hypothetical protein